GSPATELSDQFSFSVALYEALYGTRPFSGRTIEDIRKSIDSGQTAEPKGRTVDVPSRLRRALVRGLAAKPEDRYPSMDAMLSELAKSTAGRRRYLAVAGLALVGIAAGVVAVKATISEPAAAPACADADERLRGVWSPERRAELARAFEGAQGFEGFAAEVDGYLLSWRKTYQHSCKVAQADRDREADHLVTLDCLLRRRDSLDSMLRVFADSDDAALDNAVMAAASLPPIISCADAKSLRSGVQPPATKAQVDEVARIRAVVDEVEVLGKALRLQNARDKARQAVSDAREVEYPPVLAEALVARADEISDVEPKEAIKLIEEAVLVAEEAGYDHMRAKGLVRLFAVQSRASTDHNMLDQLARRAESAVQRFGRDDSLLGQLRLLRAREDMKRGKLQSAEKLYEEALAIYQRVHGPEDLKVVDVYKGLARVASMRGNWEAAVAHQESALAIEKKHHPTSHPRVVLQVERLARTYTGLGDHERARRLMEATASFWATTRGKDLVEAALGEDSGKSAARKTVRGKVVDSAGRPVAGADVVAGKLVVADGLYLTSRSGGIVEARLRVARTTSADDGTFALDVADDADLFLAAEHADRGRSVPPEKAPISEGKPSARPFRLELRPFGRLEGRAEGADELPPGTTLYAGLVASRGSGVPLAQVVARKGEFNFGRLPAGRYVLRLVRANQDASNVESTEVEIRPGETTRTDVKLTATGQRIEVLVKLKGGGQVTASQVLLVEGEFDIERGGKAANTKLLSEPRLRSAFTNRSQPAVFSGVAPGQYSVCVVPLAGDVADRDFMKAVQDNIEDVEIHCQPTAVSSQSPTAVVVEVEGAYAPPAR
ncbi:MAG: tetratricopeptide repeat protein, partial [Deltaproteobacteria bacterium]|nr:tetratricopeptide repeat protein [Deltaproteobacteria bacterium]